MENTIYKSDISTKIVNSKFLNQEEKKSFLKLIIYFTPKEIE
jgi:hypothetical protein